MLYRNNYFSIKANKGFTLIESLVFLFIFSLITITFYQVITVGSNLILVSKNKLGAVALANEKMEIIRNLKYDDVGVVGGACVGTIPQDEEVTENGRKYHVHTLAIYVDDPFDGILNGNPNDLAYEDYKMVQITVSWNEGSTNKGSVSLTSQFVPAGLEAINPADGILSINVFSDQAGGVAVAGATVQISNSDLSFNESRQTDTTGNVMIVGAKQSIQKYRIAVSKNDYESVSTLPPFPVSTFKPVDVDASVVAGSLNVINIIENKVANIKITTVDHLDNPVANINFILSGGRKIGTDATDPAKFIYNLDVTDKTDSNGKKEFNSISPGQYTFALAPTETSYTLIGIDSISPFAVASDTTKDIKAKVASNNETALLLNIIKSTDNTPIVGATVELKNTSLNYDETIVTGADGMAFFPTTADTFQPETYSVSVKASGFKDNTGNETVNQGSLTSDPIKMVAE